MIQIIPAVIPGNLIDLRQKVNLVKDYVKWVQIDVMDGDFVSSVSWPYETEDLGEFQNMVSLGERLPFADELSYEIDLMVSNPETEIQKWYMLGVRRFLIHIESVESSDVLEHIFVKAPPGAQIGVALSMGTGVDLLEPILSEVSVVQFMGIDKIGYQGQPFNKKVIDSIKELRKLSKDVIISVDGGVSLSTAPALVEAGAQRLVSGSAIFGSGNIASAISHFKALA